MDVTCLHCETTAPVPAGKRLPDDWRWWTRRGEGLNAAPCCPGCWDLKASDRTLRRVGGPVSRAARGGTRG
jgi:hypothetical protein